MHRLSGELSVFSIIRSEVRQHRQRVRVGFCVRLRLDELFGFLHSLTLIAGILQRPRQVSGDAQYILVIAVRRSFVNERRIRFPASVALLLSRKPLLGSRNQLRIHVVDLRHLVELHEPVRGQDFVRRRVAEPGKAPTRNFKCQQPLVAVADIAFGLRVHFRCQLLRALHVIQRQHIRVRARRGLFEAAERHPQQAVHPFNHLAQRPGIKPDENLAGIRNRFRGEV